MTTLAPPTTRTVRPGVAERARVAVLSLDWIMLGSVLVLSALGLFVLRASTQNDIAADPSYYFARQLGYTLVGLVLMGLVATLRPGWLARVTWPAWWVLLGSLVLVVAIAGAVRGSSSWFEIGAFNLQPSEMGKVVLILVLASVVVERRGTVSRGRFSLLLAGVAALPVFLILLQPDLGTASVYMVILAVVLFLAGAPWTHLVGAGALVGLVIASVLFFLPAIGVQVLEDYQRERITAFVSADRGDNQTGYQLDQSLTAIGSGGAFGKGPNGATQTINDFLPEHHTDFIFAVTGEMLGFVGAGAVVVLFGLLVWRGLRTMAQAATVREQIIAGGVVAAITYQVFVTIGMTLRLLPITGLPLPLMSYGGSHTLTTFVALGLLVGIHRRRVPLSA